MTDDRQNVVDMAGTRVDDDHLLSMYIDNELDAERTIALVERLRAEPALSERLSAMECNDVALRTLYTQADQDIPEHLAAMVQADNVVVVSFAQRWQTWATATAAASCAAIVALVVNLNQSTDLNPMTMDILLANSLETSRSSAAGWESLGDDRQFRSVLTFPAADGRWCREYLLAQEGSHWRGVACRDEGQWVNQVVGSEVFLEQETQYRPAGVDDSETVARFIDETATDVALGPQQEAALISSGW
jgi:hypothetical protein